MSFDYDAICVVSYGGPRRPEDVLPFMRNATRGRGIPDERLVEVSGHYQMFGGASPINERNAELMDALRAALAERGVDVREHVRWMRIRTPADIERDTRSPGGSIYGTSSNGARAAFQRPANASPIPGLFLVGGSAHPGGGLPLVGMSAEIVATLIGSGRS